MDSKDNNRLAAVEAILADFALGMQKIQDTQAETAKQIKEVYQQIGGMAKSNGLFVEVKYKARDNDISKVLNKAVTFRENFPYYANHQVYLGYASLAFDNHIEKECIKNGIAIIKQVGDSVVINDEHLKAF